MNLNDEELLEQLQKSTGDFGTDVIREALHRILKQLNPIVKINQELRADIKKVLSHGKKPRKQPKPDAWLPKKQCPDCKAVEVILDKEMGKYVCLKCDITYTKDELNKKVAQDG